jgi:hypothetical protein
MSSSCESILDHIAGYQKFISKAQSFWFTLNTSYDHGCHLASQFRLEPNDYKVLLVVAGPALYTQLGFAIKPTVWRKFLGGHRFAVDNCTVEFEQKKIDIDAYIDGAQPSHSNRGGFLSCGIRWQQQEATRRRRQGKGNEQACEHNNQLEVTGVAMDDSNDW